MKTNRRESAVSAAIHAYLGTRTDFFFWRENTIAGYAPSGRFIKSNMRGAADFIGLQAMALPTPFGGSIFVGRFVAIECKREKGGKQSADQELFQENVEAHGGLYVLASSVDTVAKALGPVQLRIPKHVRLRVVPR